MRKEGELFPKEEGSWVSLGVGTSLFVCPQCRDRFEQSGNVRHDCTNLFYVKKGGEVELVCACCGLPGTG